MTIDGAMPSTCLLSKTALPAQQNHVGIIQMETNIDITIIIPIYNAEDYLSRCVDSVMANRDITMQVVLVDDGSADSSPQICDRYASRYENVMALHVQNGGPASAKNHGLRVAKGRYVAMIDSDDELCTDMLSSMVATADETNADICCCNYLERYEDGHVREFEYSNKVWTHDRTAAVRAFLRKEKIYTQCWTKIYRRRLIDDHKISNVEGISTDEDYIFNICCMVRANRVTVIDRPLYIYSMRDTSLSKDYFRTNISRFVDNRLLRFSIVEEMVSRWSPANHEDSVYSRLYYSNELLGHIALAPQMFGDPRTRKVMRYMRLHFFSVMRYHREIGLSMAGAWLMLLPTRLYMTYRKRKCQ